jgi:S-(hydroxymethyl)glutathione dehydrogenase/alcohol dehydrogenase
VARQTQTAVVRGAGQAPQVETLELAELTSGEVLIDVAAAGVCHTDLAMAAGELWPSYPVALGHEIAGTVVECAPDVSSVRIGDRVLVMDGHCGRCADCEDGHPVQCRTYDQAERMRHLTDADGNPVLQSVGGFSTRLITPAHSVFAIPDDISFEVAAVLGCSVVTGAGAVLNVAQVRPGASVAVLGCGGVGVNAVMAAAAAGATTVVGVDPDPVRRELAEGLGATLTCPPDLDVLRGLRPGGFDVVIECVGRPAAMELATALLSRGGCAVLVGAAPEGTTFAVDALALILDQKRILGCLRGDIRPDRDFPMLFDLHRSGALALDRLVTHRFPLSQVAEAFANAGSGRGLRTVVLP